MLGRTPATTNPKVKHVRIHAICGSTDVALKEHTWTLRRFPGAERLSPTVAERSKPQNAPHNKQGA